MMVVAAVIRIGRSRSRPARRIASSRSKPDLRSWLTWSSSTMPLLTTMPIRISRPIWAIRLKRVPVAASIQAAPGRAKGIENRIAKGWASDSKSEAMTR